MLEENKNLKSQIKDTSHTLSEKDKEMPVLYENYSSRLGSYTKTNKLVSALYMVTDVMDKNEPLRNKLRELGTNIISDIHLPAKGQIYYNQINNRVSEVLSFIEIASSIGIISEMNSGILIKEFIEFRKSITEVALKDNKNWLEEFMKEDKNLEVNVPEKSSTLIREINFSNGQTGTRIGVQRGGTLMQALSDKIPHLSTLHTFRQEPKNVLNKNLKVESVDVLKNKRREEIILVIKDKMKNSINFDGVIITDIKALALSVNGGGVLASCGEKTLQRELVSMVSSGILKKTGEKRWSRYYLN